MATTFEREEEVQELYKKDKKQVVIFQGWVYDVKKYLL